MFGESPSSSARAIVSPIARPSPRMAAPTMPARAHGSIAVRTISHRVAPRARAASRCSRGTVSSTSRVRAAVIGNTMTASTSADRR